MLRWSRRPTKKRSTDNAQVWALGVRVGYFPCLEAPFLECTIGRWTYDVWYGLPSLEQVESGDR